MQRLSLFLFSLLFVLLSVRQNGSAEVLQPITKNDTLQKNTHSPTKANYLAIIPGLGQIYNKKYWKIPIVYAGFGITAYFGITNKNLYKKYGEAYTCKFNDPKCSNELAQKYTLQDLMSIRDYYRRNMELSFIVMGAWYILQMLDAVVDANFYHWEVSNNLSISIQPVTPSPLLPPKLQFNGLSIKVNF